ncbi:unnamed protein product [Hermetia illucens]|uniref:Uncharacterized protein n=2 Tax=Hermetia illucens TaxID=343691 RepID=A0A7R8UEK0_HERIL|nr:unnamed protein product [Hermetia illucens]
MATHTMAPNHLLCGDFIESMLKTQADHTPANTTNVNAKVMEPVHESDSDESDGEVKRKSKRAALEKYTSVESTEIINKTKQLKKREKLRKMLEENIEIIL